MVPEKSGDGHLKAIGKELYFRMKVRLSVIGYDE